MVKKYFLSVAVSIGTAFCAAAHTAAVSPYTFTGRVMDARHSAFDTNRVAVVEVLDASGNILARTKTIFSASSRRNYAVAVPMSTSAAEGYAVQGNAVVVSVTDDLGKTWSGMVVDAFVGVAGGVREVDIVLGVDEDGDGIDDSLCGELEAQWENSGYWVYGERFDPRRDYDGDGVTTVKEALSGTDPFNPDDVLKITEFLHARGSGSGDDAAVSLSFGGVGGRAYSVEEATDLSKNDWKKCDFLRADAEGVANVLSLPSNAGGKSLTVYLLPSSSGNAFYRVKAE